MTQMSHIANQALIEDARVGFHAAFMSQLEDMAPDTLEQLARTLPSTTAIEVIEWLGAVAGFTEWKGDRKLTDREAFKLTVANRDWSGGLSIHQNNIKDDKLALFGDEVSDLVRGCKTHRYDLIVDTLTNGFDGANTDIGNGLCFDNGFFFHAAHPLSNGATQSNKLTVALSPSGLTSARQLLRTMRDATGRRRLNLTGTHLVVGPKNEEYAEKLMSADVLVNSAGTAADSNTQKGKYKILVSPRLVDDFDDDWYLADLTPSAWKPVIFQLRQDIETSDQADPGSPDRFARGKINFGAEARYATAYLSYMNIVGSRP